MPPPLNKKVNKKSGFTLIELSIVLVIIGLIVGGVLVGQDLIAAAELRSMQQKKTQLETAVITFKLKYNALPGDIPNAYQFFAGSIGCTDASGTGIAGTGCNGDGDKKIEYRGEMVRMFQQLQVTGLISEDIAITASLSDVSTSLASSPKGVQPVGPRTGVWNLSCGQTIPSPVLCDQFMPGGNGNHGFRFGNYSGVTSGWPINPFRSGILTPIEANSWDSKFDDGNANTGNIIGQPNNNGCKNKTTGVYGNTQNDKEQIRCWMTIKAGF